MLPTKPGKFLPEDLHRLIGLVICLEFQTETQTKKGYNQLLLHIIGETFCILYHLFNDRY